MIHRYKNSHIIQQVCRREWMRVEGGKRKDARTQLYINVHTCCFIRQSLHVGGRMDTFCNSLNSLSCSLIVLRPSSHSGGHRY